MDMEQMKYLTEIPQILLDDSIKEYAGFNQEKNCSENIIKKEGDTIMIHSSVYGFLESNELMDDIIDYYIKNKSYKKLIIFDDTSQSVIRLDY